MAYTATELNEMLAEVKTAISRVLTAQEYSAGANLSIRRALLKDLQDREQWLLKEIASAGGSVGGGFDSANAAVFVKAK